MNIRAWIRGRLRSDYTRQGLLVRLVADLFLSNFGFFLGMLTTVMIWVFTWTVTPQTFLHEMFMRVWLANVPMLTACCLVAYTLSGLYRGTKSRNVPFGERTFRVTTAVGGAFVLFVVWVFLADVFIPRTTMVAGWFFIFVFIAGVRFLATVFFRRYDVVHSGTYDPKIDRIVRKLSLIFQQDGWVPPESLPETATWPYFEEDEIVAAASVLQSGRINQWTGREIEKFQEEFAAVCGVRRAVALANGTVALELALRACGIGPGDEVVVTPRTFIASASCAVLQGATPVFADVDRDSQNITDESIRAVLTPRTKAVIAVHLAGWPCDMEAIMAVAAEKNLVVIEDCAQAHGAMFRGSPVGSFGHVAAFSFCQDKIMTTGGEGGMLLTNDDGIWESAWAFKDHGKSYDAVFRRMHPEGYRWLHESFGTNWRMTEMQAAIGRRQLAKLPEWVRIRRENAGILAERFASLDALRVADPGQDIHHSYYKYYVFVRPERLKTRWDRDRIIREVTDKGMPCFSGSCSEIYLEKAFADSGLQPAERLPVARELGETSLMFLVHPTLSKGDMHRVAAAVTEVVTEATG